MNAAVARRLTTIAFADVVGYSTLMSVDERGTFERWMTLLRGVVEPELELRGGRIVDLAGDGVLAEFPTSLAAVEWARSVQRKVRSGAEAHANAVPLALRIGIHAGEVFASDQRIFGDAVNLAARLQGHAAPGGIVISAAVQRQICGTINADLRDLGYLDVKGFERPAHLYTIETDIVRPAVPTLAPGGLPSVVVLPLMNLGGDPGDEYLGEGIAEAIGLSLASLHELFVMNSGSALAFRGKRPDPREIGRILGVRYAVTGSLRRSPDRLHISIQLNDAQAGAMLWGGRMQFSPGDLFDVQDEIVRKVVVGLAPHVRAAELRRAMRKRPESLTAYDCLLRAMHVMGSADRETFEQARSFLNRAMAEDAGFALPAAWAGRWHSVRIARAWSTCPREDSERAMSLAERAVSLDPTDSLALATLGHLKSILRHDSDAAMQCFEEALAACPNNALAWTLSSGTLSYLGRGDEAVRHAEQGLRLSPLDPLRFSQRMFLAIAHYARGSYEDGVRWARLSAAENPLHTATLKILTVSLSALGHIDEAREAGQRVLALEPNFRVTAYAKNRLPFVHGDIRASFVEHLRHAGLPD